VAYKAKWDVHVQSMECGKLPEETPYKPKGKRIWGVRERDRKTGTGDSLILDDDYYYY
jgi:hypothetical protein